MDGELKRISFQDKYKSLFEKLDQEPDKEKRWQMFSSDKVLYDRFAADYFVEYYDFNRNELRVAGSTRPREYDCDVFMRTLKKAIRSYHLDGGASFYTFFSLVYKKEIISDSFRKEGITDTMIKLISAIEKIQERGKEKTAEQIIREYGKDFEQEGICKIFKASAGTSDTLQLADVPLKVIAYLDRKGVPLNDENYNLEEIVADDAAMKPFQRIEDELDDSMYESIKEFLRCKVITEKENPKQWEFYRAFWTRDIIAALKLENDRKPYQAHPAGDTEMYHKLNKIMGSLWNQIFYRDYIVNTIEEGPEDREYLYGQYYNMLSISDITSHRMLSRIMNKSEQTLRNRETGNENNYSHWKESLESAIWSILREGRERERSF